MLHDMTRSVFLTHSALSCHSFTRYRFFVLNKNTSLKSEVFGTLQRRRRRHAVLLVKASAQDDTSEESTIVPKTVDENAEPFEQLLAHLAGDVEDDVLQRLAEQHAREKEGTAGLPVLTMEYLFGLEGREPEEELEEGEVQPAAPPAAEQAMTDGPSRREVAAALLRSLPGIKPTKLTGEEVPDVYETSIEEGRDVVLDSPPLHSGQVPLNEWELRAIMEKRRRKEEQLEDWMDRRSEVGIYPNIAADWRSDVRCRDSGDPNKPFYREWTHREIWDLITLSGRAADPRDVKLTVLDPLAPADAVAKGVKYEPETEEWLESIGKLIDPESEADIEDRKAEEEAMLEGEFSDFEELGPATGSTASYDDY